jgi:hypothetical protein
MPLLHGRETSLAELAAFTGAPSAHAGIRRLEASDGAERGLRVLEVTSGGGLVFEVLPDRAFDLGRASYRGVPFAWASATGQRPPGLADAEGEDGLGLLRAYSGLMTTCGLDHFGGPVRADGRHFAYPRRAEIAQPLHGRLTHQPGKVTALREDWTAGELVIEGEVTQAAVYAEHLVLQRRISVPIGGATIRIEDRVINRGFVEQPVMLLYHVNFGWPLLAPGARIAGTVGEPVWSSHGGAGSVRWTDVAAPTHPFVEQVWQHAPKPGADGFHRISLDNPALGFGVEVSARAATLPNLLQWQAYSSGLYALGVEPATHGVDPRGADVVLAPGEARAFEVRIGTGSS